MSVSKQRGCKDIIRQSDAGCCRPQRKRPGMEGNQGVDRVLADNGQPASVGRPELKNKTHSCHLDQQTPHAVVHLRKQKRHPLSQELNMCSSLFAVIYSHLIFM